jgi:restriction endonuclease S subunit
VDGRFLYYLTVSTPFSLLGEATIYGAHGVKRVDDQFVRNFTFGLPPLSEQRAVSAFLDRETAHIDELVAKKERLRRLLDEALTRRIDLALARERETATWRLKYLAKAPLSYGANEAAEHEEPTWPRYIRTTDIDAGGRLREETFRSLPPETASTYLLGHGDILLTRSGATVGKSFRYREEMGPACHAGYLIRFQPDPGKVLSEYAAFFFRSNIYWRQIRDASIQATIQNVSAERYGNLPLPILPLHVQAEIVKQLTAEAERTDGLISTLSNQCTLLKERRQALITAAVTGQIDVRQAAPDRDQDSASLVQ